MKLDGPVEKRLTLRLNAEQWHIVSEVAKRANLSPAEVMRGAVHTLADRLPRGWERRINEPPQEFQNNVRRLWKEINRIGVNLNQLTRRAHASSDDGLKALISQAQADFNHLKNTVSSYVNYNR